VNTPKDCKNNGLEDELMRKNPDFQVL